VEVAHTDLAEVAGVVLVEEDVVVVHASGVTAASRVLAHTAVPGGHAAWKEGRRTVRTLGLARFRAWWRGYEQ
jgi:hypothetical protein